MSFAHRRVLGGVLIAGLLLSTGAWAAQGRPLPDLVGEPPAPTPAVVRLPALAQAAREAARQRPLPSSLDVQGRKVALRRNAVKDAGVACDERLCVLIARGRVSVTDVAERPVLIQSLTAAA